MKKVQFCSMNLLFSFLNRMVNQSCCRQGAIHTFHIQLFRERLSQKLCTRQSRKVVWDMINELFLTLYCSCRTYFCCFPLALANIRPWPLVPFFEISFKNSELKTTHNTFRDCRVPFFRTAVHIYLPGKIFSIKL